MDTSKIGRWFIRLTINSGTPWSDRVAAADEAAHRERHPDRQRPQGELAQARGQHRTAGEPAHRHASGQQRHRGDAQRDPQPGQARQVLGEIGVLTTEAKTATAKIVAMRYSMRVGDRVEIR